MPICCLEDVRLCAMGRHAHRSDTHLLRALKLLYRCYSGQYERRKAWRFQSTEPAPGSSHFQSVWDAEAIVEGQKPTQPVAMCHFDRINFRPASRAAAILSDIVEAHTCDGWGVHAIA